MIHNRWPALVKAMGPVSAAPADTRCTAIESGWPGLVERLAR